MAAPTETHWCSGPYARALRAGRGPLFLRHPDGLLIPLEVERWCAAADVADHTVLRHCVGAVLDIGCGPGRITTALTEMGNPVLGIDTSPEAVVRTRSTGGTALRRSVFEPLPAEGRWGSALLLDGNIGIGGDPAALLERVRQLLVEQGLLMVETSREEVEERLRVRVDDGEGRQGPTFPWARVGPSALRRCAGTRRWRVRAEWAVRGRRFTALEARGRG
ncbi:class I SAM-dependent methyltransferase [Streptomyces sp. NPDC005438]|uniref:class I SAM-dependent methyltransferase n=1 Tax=Streptomyces sp. NPDC005438 TaxID=3156880 RepID=UPI0033BCF65E